MKNTALNALGLVFTVAERVQDFDYVAVGARVIDFAVTAYAVTVAVTSYLYFALRLWWAEHGETVTVGAVRLAVGTVDLVGDVLQLGRDTRVAFNRLATVASDRAFYLAAGF